MNDERPIENLLRRAALERIAGAGEPLELNAEKRAALQAEVAKQFPPQPTVAAPANPTGQSANPVGDWWLLIKQRWVYGVAAFAAIWVIALIVAPILSKPKPGSLATSSRFDQIEPLPGPTAAVPTASVQPEVANALSETKLGFESPAVAAKKHREPAITAPLAKPSGGKVGKFEATAPEAGATAHSSVALNSPATAGVNAENFAARSGSDRLATTADTAAVLEAERQLVTSAAKENPAASIPPRIRSSQQFSNAASALRSREADRFRFEQPLQPLRKQFRIEQSGRDLRVIDSDGSVYRGFVDESKTVYTEVIQRKNTALSNSFDQKFKLSSAKATAAETAAQRDSIYYRYRAEGTNRTLNQMVVFTWNFIPTNEAAATRLNLQKPVLNSSITETQFPALLQSSRINGVIRFGSSGAAPVDAQPAK